MEYIRFLQYPSLDTGSVIKYFLNKSGITGKQLAERSGLTPQRVSDFANNHRRITAEVSFKLENAFGIDHKGYFYLIQTNHDIYLASHNDMKRETPRLSEIKKQIFWDSDMAKIDWNANRKHIIQRVFEYGDENAIKEIIRFYGASEVKSTLSQIKDKRLADRRDYNILKYL